MRATLSLRGPRRRIRVTMGGGSWRAEVETPAFRSDSGSRCEAGGGGGCFVAG